MRRLTAIFPGALAALAALALLTIAVPGTAAIFGGDKAEAKAAEAKPPTLKETMSAVAMMSKELKGLDTIDKHLSNIDKSVAGIEASLVPVGAALKPEGFRAMVTVASDYAYERGKALILFATACIAVLLVLGAVLLRWSLSGHVAPVAPSPSPSASNVTA